MSNLDKFEKFLGSIDLEAYREKYSHIKLVELDLPKEVQSIPHIFQCYWENKSDWPLFEKFYEKYKTDLSVKIERFREKSLFSKETFNRGLPARTYRTWTSLLTQIQGGYLAEKIYGEANVTMNAELDWKGIDFRVLKGNSEFNMQVKKDTMSREVRAPYKGMKHNVEIRTIVYKVTGERYKKNGEERKPFKDWKERWDGKLDVLDNGFVVFRKGIFDALEEIE